MKIGGDNLGLDIKFFDELFPPEFAGYSAPKGYLVTCLPEPGRRNGRLT